MENKKMTKEKELKKNIQSGIRFNICQDVNCHENLLTEQEIRSGFCQKHGGLLSDKEFENYAGGEND